MSNVMPYVIALVPSIGVGLLFWIVIKNMIEGDRKERLAHSQWEAEQAALAGRKRPAEESVQNDRAELVEQSERPEEKSGHGTQEKQNGDS
jgi:hypothetical protein